MKSSVARMGICVVAVGCAAALQAGQVSDDFVAAARAAYAKDEFCRESIVGKFAKAGVHDDKTPGRTVRWIDVDGVRNVRDIGGWTGLRVGRVFRGTELGDVTEKDGNSHGYDLTQMTRKSYATRVVVRAMVFCAIATAAQAEPAATEGIGGTKEVRLDRVEISRCD